MGVRGAGGVRRGVGCGFGVRENDGAGVPAVVGAAVAAGAPVGLGVGRLVGAGDDVCAGDGREVGRWVGPSGGLMVGTASVSEPDRVSSSQIAAMMTTAAMRKASTGRIRRTGRLAVGITPLSFYGAGRTGPRMAVVARCERETGIEPA